VPVEIWLKWAPNSVDNYENGAFEDDRRFDMAVVRQQQHDDEAVWS
jgi:hypothetical protein